MIPIILHHLAAILRSGPDIVVIKYNRKFHVIHQQKHVFRDFQNPDSSKTQVNHHNRLGPFPEVQS